MRISDWSSDVCSSDLTGAAAVYRPILVGGVFNAVNPAVYAARGQADNRRLQHSWKILKDWARLADVPMNFPSRWHPAKSIAAMRFCFALEEDQVALIRFARGAFARYFDRQENQIGRATSELPSLMRLSSAVFCLN